MVRRVCREFGSKRNIVVINDEAHHCYRGKPAEADGRGRRRRAQGRGQAGKPQKRDEEARVWISGLEAVKKKIGIRAIYDLSATPFFLRGSGYAEGTLFPWVVSDFSLVDAIECGIVKVPRVPVADDAMTVADPEVPPPLAARQGQPAEEGAQDRRRQPAACPSCPRSCEAALHSLYGNYEKYYEAWERAADERGEGSRLTPPVFIVVCNNTNVSKLVFDWIAGWEQTISEGDEAKTHPSPPATCSCFSNVEHRASGPTAPTPSSSTRRSSSRARR